MSNKVKIIVDKSTLPKWKPGLITDYNITDVDLAWSDGRQQIQVIVVLGNSQFRNGRRLTLYVLPAVMANEIS
jgi:hypothetical protein